MPFAQELLNVRIGGVDQRIHQPLTPLFRCSLTNSRKGQTEQLFEKERRRFDRFTRLSVLNRLDQTTYMRGLHT